MSEVVFSKEDVEGVYIDRTSRLRVRGARNNAVQLLLGRIPMSDRPTSRAALNASENGTERVKEVITGLRMAFATAVSEHLPEHSQDFHIDALDGEVLLALFRSLPLDDAE